MNLTPNARRVLEEAIARFESDARDLQRCEQDPAGRIPHEVALELKSYTHMCDRLRAILDGRDPGGPPPLELRLA